MSTNAEGVRFASYNIHKCVGAARRFDPARTAAVIEDAVSGVAAGAAGGFALVLGVDRTGGHAAALTAAGAHVVVGTLTQTLGSNR